MKTAMMMVLGGLAGGVLAQPVIDGTIAGDNYGSAYSVQTVQTQFGDNASELNAAYARVQDGKLFLSITGNLEGNFNKLNIFFDTVAGGQTVIDGANNPGNDGWAAKHNGMSFDSNFAADYMLIFRRGFGGGDKFDIDWAKVGGGAADGAQIASFNTQSPNGLSLSQNVNGQQIDMTVAFDNSNVAGVLGGTAAADQAAALAVQTGLEFSINLDALGIVAGTDFKVSAMVNGSNHDYLSNQILGGLLPDQGNLGGDGSGGFTGTLGGINLNNFAGDQWFLVPAPGATALLAVGGLAAVRRRR